MEDQLKLLQQENARLKKELQQIKDDNDLIKSNSDILLWGSNSAYWDWDYKTGHVQFSDKKLGFLGFTRDNFDPHVESFTGRIHPEDHERVLESMTRVLKGEAEVWDCEYRIRKKDGSYIWFHDMGKVSERYEDGSPKKISGVTNDISKRKQAEEETKHKLNELQSINRNIRIITWSLTFDMNGNQIQTIISPVADELLGLPENTINNDFDVFLNYVHEDYRDEMVKRIKQGIINPGNNIKYEYKVIKGDGSEAWFSSLGHAVVEDDIIVGYGTTIDISEKKKSEIEQKAFAAYVENNNDIIIVKDLDRRIIATNMAFAKTNGKKTVEEILGKTDSEILNISEDKEPVSLYLKDDLEVMNYGQGDVLIREEPVIYSDGRTHTHLTRKFPIFNDDGDIVSIGIVSTDITKLKTAEEKLRESEYNLRALFNLMDDIVFEMDYDGTYLNIAPTSPDLMFKSPDDILGKTLFDAFDNETANHFLQFIRSSLDDNETKTIEYPLEINNKTYWFSGKSTPNRKTVLYIAREITDQKQAELNIQSLNQRMKIAVDSAGIGIWDLDLINNNLVWDEWMYKLYGIKNDEFENNFEAWQKSLHPDDFERANKTVEDAINGNGNFSTEFRIITPKGDTRYIKASAFVKYDDDGKAVRMTGANYDITDQKLYENEIRLLNEAVQQSPVGIMMTKKNGNIIFVNDKFEEHTGYSKEEVIGKNPRILKSGIHDKDFYKDLWQTITSGNTWKNEIRNKRKDGKIIWDDVVISPVKDDNHNISHFVSITQDVSKLKQLVSDLTVAKENAEMANKLKTEFLHNMSHEVRTPMNAILGFSSMLSDSNISGDDRSGYVNIIQNSSNQLLKIIDDILEISTLEAGQVKTVNEMFNLNKLMNEIHSTYSLKSLMKNLPLNIRYALQKDNCFIYSDKSKINRVLSILIDNAIKFTNEGFIEFGYEVVEDELEFFVKDTGIGISNKNQEVIFDRFSQEEKELSKKYGGLGLGLSISKEIATLLGGNIRVESAKGVGTTFYLNIPYKPATPAQPSEKPKEDNSKKLFNGLKILIAEDESSNFMFLETIFKLNSDNIKIIHAKNGNETIELFKETPDLDIILMDIKMPGIDGYEATRLIKKMDPDIPIIAQTAYSTESEKHMALEAGCDDFISKPIEVKKLLKVIEENLVR